jgi:hypothetical protein
MWGARGPFPPAAAMVVAAVPPVVFVLRLLKNAFCKQSLYLVLFIVKHIRIVAWPEPKPLWSNRVAL